MNDRNGNPTSEIITITANSFLLRRLNHVVLVYQYSVQNVDLVHDLEGDSAQVPVASSVCFLPPPRFLPLSISDSGSRL